ncbi:MAG: hypothetical protein LBL48_06810 [Azoarcus sp.]|jgi:hypothetical protein|nr:hypothetical protein [Azoarcus sp.]
MTKEIIEAKEFVPAADDGETAADEFDAGEVGTLIDAAAVHDNGVRTLAARIGYLLPADSTNPDLICRDIAANMRRSVDACLEIGRALLVLKQACGHGNFIVRLDAMGLDREVAARFMSAARKIPNVPTSAHLVEAIGTQSKLLELLMLDDEQIDELAETGQTGELKLDDVACMGVRELRKAVRELRERTNTKDRVLAEKNKTIDRLQEQLVDRSAPPAGEEADDEEEGRPRVTVEIEMLEKTVEEIETLAVRLGIRVRGLRSVLPDAPTRRARESAALMRAFAALRTTAIELDIAVTDDGEATIDPEADDDDLARIVRQQQERGHGLDGE